MPCSICSLDGFYLNLNIAPIGCVCRKHVCFLCHHRWGFTQTYQQTHGLKGRLTSNYLQVSFECRVLYIWWWLILITWCWHILHCCTYRVDFRTWFFQCPSAALYTEAVSTAWTKTSRASQSNQRTQHIYGIFMVEQPLWERVAGLLAVAALGAALGSLILTRTVWKSGIGKPKTWLCFWPCASDRQSKYSDTAQKNQGKVDQGWM